MLKDLEPKNLPVYHIDYIYKDTVEYINIPPELVESDIQAMKAAETLFYAGLLIRKETPDEPLGKL